jgi:putative membrane protein
MGEAERKHVMETMAVGSLSLASSRVAVKKARDEDVKEFAQFEVAEQETIADILKSMQEGRASGKIDAPSDSEVRQHITQQDQAMLQKMEQMQAGDEFDRAYVRAQTDGHEKLLRIQEDYLASGKNAAHLNVVKLARGQIKEHLTLLADISEDDRATTGQSKSAK